MKPNFSLKNCIVSLNPNLPSGKPTSFVMKGAVGYLQSWVENYLQSHSPGEGCHNVSMSYDQWSWHHGSFWGEISFSRSDPGWSRSISNRTCSCAKIRCVTSLPYLKTRFSSGVSHPGSPWGTLSLHMCQVLDWHGKDVIAYLRKRWMGLLKISLMILLVWTFHVFTWQSWLFIVMVFFRANIEVNAQKSALSI